MTTRFVEERIKLLKDNYQSRTRVRGKLQAYNNELYRLDVDCEELEVELLAHHLRVHTDYLNAKVVVTPRFAEWYQSRDSNIGIAAFAIVGEVVNLRLYYLATPRFYSVVDVVSGQDGYTSNFPERIPEELIDEMRQAYLDKVKAS